MKINMRIRKNVSILRLTYLFVLSNTPQLLNAELSYKSLYIEKSTETRSVNPVFYIHTEQSKDLRKKTIPFLSGSVKRISFDAYSFEEWQDYIGFMTNYDILLRASELKRIEKIRFNFLKNQNWPKILVTDSDICVPSLNYINSIEWRSHLICSSNITPTSKLNSSKMRLTDSISN